MEIEMVEMGCEKAADPPEFKTLASGLLKDYDNLEANKHLLSRKTDRLTKSTIGNKSLLPQQVRGRVKAKAADDARMSAYIEQENMTDLDLFKEVNALKDCCRQSSDLAAPTNCIKRGFTSDTTFDFLGCCFFVRRYYRISFLSQYIILNYTSAVRNKITQFLFTLLFQVHGKKDTNWKGAN